MRNIILAVTTTLALTGQASADGPLRMATTDAGLPQAITMTLFADLVSSNIDNLDIQVESGGAATAHMIELGSGNLDMAMVTPATFNLMQEGKAMFSRQQDSPALAEQLRLLMWFPYGQYHFAVRADSDIQFLEDLRGATVFLGPKGSSAYNAAKGWIAASTGLIGGPDYETLNVDWHSGFQALLDGSVDAYTLGCLDPCQHFLTLSEYSEFRFVGPENADGDSIDRFLGSFRYREDIAADVYENQQNFDAVPSFNTSVGIAVNANLDDDLVYEITRTFWDNVELVYFDYPWIDALNVKNAATQLGNIKLHDGAARYYNEVDAAGVATID